MRATHRISILPAPFFGKRIYRLPVRIIQFRTIPAYPVMKSLVSFVQSSIPKTVHHLSRTVAQLTIFVRIKQITLVQLTRKLLQGLLTHPSLNGASPPTRVNNAHRYLGFPIHLLGKKISQSRKGRSGFFSQRHPVHSRQIVFRSMQIIA